MISRLLIANRGEVAVRIARAAAELGIPTVAVHAADDADAPHVAKADAAVALSGTGVAAYLDIEDVLAAAERAGADAVHPGYGFLSENPRFAAACATAGIVFVGPDPATLERCGDKTRARELAAELGIPVPAGTGPTDAAGAAEFQRGLPAPGAVMLKAVAGGGGRGIRPVLDPAGLAAAHARCASEAAAAFGDDRVYAEELLTPARHVEVQLLGDGTGAVVALGERDCSIQQRRQKLVEVAPAPGLSDARRTELADAAVRLGQAVALRGLATAEFLLTPDRWAFCEVNARLQVEHTITEEVTGIDLVAAQLRVAGGATLAELGLDRPPPVRGTAVQLRISAGTVHPDGSTVPAAGVLTAFELPAGRGVRVDAAGHPGYRTTLRYDPLLAKLVVHDRTAGLPALAARAGRALSECRIAGVDTTLDLLAGIVAHPAFAAGELDTGFLDRHLAEILAVGRPHRFAEPDEPAAPSGTGSRSTPVPDGLAAARAAGPGTVVAVQVEPGERVSAGATLVALEALKMEHVVLAPEAGTVTEVVVAVGDTVAGRDVLVLLEPSGADGSAAAATAAVDPDHIRPDLAEVRERHAVGSDERRTDAVARRHRTGLRTARENLADLCDPGSFVEYGGLAVAAQRRRRSLQELIERTPADGMLAGTATINAELVGEAAAEAIVVAYDYTVLAGTQGKINHDKKDRVFELAARRGLPVVLYAEGGGGRPGDTDGLGMTGLPTRAFELFGKLSGQVPLVGVVAGRCFAGNAALLGSCDVVIAVEGASIGMGGPAMISGGGLGEVAPDDVGPTSVQVPNGVIDVLVPDEAAATRVARQYLSYFQGPVADWTAPDQRLLRHVVPENRVRVYDVRAAVHGLADVDSVLELRRGFGAGMVTALIRVQGRPLGLIANDPTHLGGAIDRDAADKAARFLQLCDAFGLPVLSLCDTPGFMVGPDSERDATVRHFGRLFVVGANLSVPLGLVVLRKCYGLGAMAVAGGSLKAPVFAVSWPTGEFGGMGLEGAVRLGYRRELDAVADPTEREELYRKMVAAQYEKGRALSVATVLEVDDVIDPADTRRWIVAGFPAAAPVGPRTGPKRRPHVDTW